MKIIAVYNIKGGVGKTATCVNLAYLASREDASTMLIDLDPQGSASFYFKVRSRKKFTAKKFLKGGKKLRRNIRGTDYEDLDSVPSNISFRKIDLHLDTFKKSTRRLKLILQPFKKQYDYIFLDCPPNITLISENIFNAANVLLVPIIPTPLSMLAYEKLMDFTQNQSYPNLNIVAFFSMVEKRKKIHRDILRDAPRKNKHFLKSTIPYAADVEKMGIVREPLLKFRPSSPAAKAYWSLWKELKTKI